MGDRYWTVTLKAYAFDTKDEAVRFRDALTDAFTAMPEAAGHGASVSCEEVIDDE